MLKYIRLVTKIRHFFRVCNIKDCIPAFAKQKKIISYDKLHWPQVYGGQRQQLNK